MKKKNDSHQLAFPFGKEFQQDFNTLAWPLFMATKKKLRTISIAGGQLTITATGPEEPLKIIRNIYLNPEDVYVPRTLEGEVLRYLIYLAQKQRDEEGNPSPVVTGNVSELLKAILPKGQNPNQRQREEVLKSLYRLKFVTFHFARFHIAENKEEKRVYRSMLMGVVESVEVSDEPGIPFAVRLNPIFYQYVIKSKLIRKLDFNVFKTLRSGIAHRLYELVVSLSPGYHSIPFWEFLERLGIVIKAKTKFVARNAKQWIDSAIKELEVHTDFQISVRFPTHSTGSVVLFIKTKEKKENIEESDELSLEEKRKLLSILQRRKQVKVPMAVFKSMGKEEREYELEQAKERALKEFSQLIKKIENAQTKLREKGITVIGETLPDLEALSRLSRKEFFSKEPELRLYLKQRADVLQKSLETLSKLEDFYLIIKDLHKEGRFPEDRFPAVPSWESLVPSLRVTEDKLAEKVEQIQEKAYSILKPFMDEVGLT